MLPILGIDHNRFTHPFRGLDVRLTGVEEAPVVRGIFASGSFSALPLRSFD